MKKLLNLFLVLGLVLFILSPVLASDTESIKTYPSQATSVSTTTLATITTVVPGKSRILGYELSPSISGSGTMTMALYDVAAVGSVSSSTVFAEAACANTASVNRTFPAPISLANGLVIMQGDGTNVIVYYENTIN